PAHAGDHDADDDGRDRRADDRDERPDERGDDGDHETEGETGDDFPSTGCESGGQRVDGGQLHGLDDAPMPREPVAPSALEGYNERLYRGGMAAPSLDELRVLDEVARRGSLSGAAR